MCFYLTTVLSTNFLLLCLKKVYLQNKKIVDHQKFSKLYAVSSLRHIHANKEKIFYSNI